MPRSRPHLHLPAFGAIVAMVLIALGGSVAGQTRPPARRNSAGAPAPAPELVERGRYLAAAGDCVACHTKAGGEPFAGGRVIQTPFGIVESANLTPDATGLGDWSADDFYRALHTGVSKDGAHLYPAFPYNYYTKVSRQDSDAIYAYLRTIEPVRNTPHRNRLPFPLNIRALMVMWNWMFFKEGGYQPDSAKSAEWNRGAYLVNGLGHCGACHTPKNMLGGPKRDRFLHGGAYANWFAPDLTANARTGLGSWSQDEIAEFLKTGRNRHASAAGEMGEAVVFSTSQLTPQDRAAMVTYLTDQPASPAAPAPKLEQAALHRGEAIFQDECSACHRMEGQGVATQFPPLKGSANLQQQDPTNTVRFILAGVRATPTEAMPTPLTMPPFAWKLTDQQVADVATYVRNAWGNQAPAVKPSEVSDLRGKLVPKNGQRPSAPNPPAGAVTPSSLRPAA